MSNYKYIGQFNFNNIFNPFLVAWYYVNLLGFSEIMLDTIYLIWILHFGIC